MWNRGLAWLVQCPCCAHLTPLIPDPPAYHSFIRKPFVQRQGRLIVLHTGDETAMLEFASERTCSQWSAPLQPSIDRDGSDGLTRVARTCVAIRSRGKVPSGLDQNCSARPAARRGQVWRKLPKRKSLTAAFRATAQHVPD